MGVLKRAGMVILFCCICGFIISCDTMGQIGGTVRFRTKKYILEKALDSLYAQYPEYKLPEKWKQYDNLYMRPSPFIEKKIFYFKSAPEEMYYVTLIDDSLMVGDTSKTSLAIKAVNTGSKNWLLENKLEYRDEDRIQKRFMDEIVAKLKVYTKAKVSGGE